MVERMAERQANLTPRPGLTRRQFLIGSVIGWIMVLGGAGVVIYRRLSDPNERKLAAENALLSLGGDFSQGTVAKLRHPYKHEVAELETKSAETVSYAVRSGQDILASAVRFEKVRRWLIWTELQLAILTNDGSGRWRRHMLGGKLDPGLDPDWFHYVRGEYEGVFTIRAEGGKYWVVQRKIYSKPDLQLGPVAPQQPTPTSTP